MVTCEVLHSPPYYSLSLVPLAAINEHEGGSWAEAWTRINVDVREFMNTKSLVDNIRLICIPNILFFFLLFQFVN